ncbi:lipase family protein [Streptomyces sp. NPDC059917]|uniref:lipase family protein n=1 Tax=Streptomyces sp. NPDC059917 TaxID=3347002 RepID=UPI00366983B0
MRIRSTAPALATATALTLTLALALPALAPTPASAARAPVGAGDRAARPGDLLSAAPSAFRPTPTQSTNTRAWKISYRSTSADGAPNVVSGTVIVPQDGRSGPRPLVGYAVGTVGLDDSCAPSAHLPKGTSAEGGIIQRLLQRGWAVAVTDYEGLGTPGPHTYSVGPSAGHAVLDAARAAQQLPEAGLSTSGPVGLLGYSQGGQATGWAAEQQRAYAPELQVKGVATGGVPADLRKVAAANDGRAGSGLVLMLAAGQDAAFPELKLDSSLKPAGKDLVDYVRTHCAAIDTTVGAFKRMADLTTTDPLTLPDWQARLNQSRLGGSAPAAPVYQYHAISDEFIPYAVAQQLRADWCAKGADVHWRAISNRGHITGGANGAPPATDWLADRFAGRPSDGNCATAGPGAVSGGGGGGGGREGSGQQR